MTSSLQNTIGISSMGLMIVSGILFANNQFALAGLLFLISCGGIGLFFQKRWEMLPASEKNKQKLINEVKEFVKPLVMQQHAMGRLRLTPQHVAMMFSMGDGIFVKYTEGQESVIFLEGVEEKTPLNWHLREASDILKRDQIHFM